MKYKSIIITGASSGLGTEFAMQLAPHAEELVLVARRGDRLEVLKEKLTKLNSDLTVHCEALDLNNEEEITSLCNKLSDGTYQPDTLINNAGLGDLGSFSKSNWEKLHSMLNLNMVALTRLAYATIPSMQKHKQGFILNVSSMASVMPIPDFAVYAATKSYVTSFSEALRLELKEENINVTALCPGPIHTEFGALADRDEKKSGPDMKAWAYVTPTKCVEEALKALNKNKATIFPGIHIKVFTRLFKSTPMPILRLIMGRRPRRVD